MDISRQERSDSATPSFSTSHFTRLARGAEIVREIGAQTSSSDLEDLRDAARAVVRVEAGDQTIDYIERLGEVPGAPEDLTVFVADSRSTESAISPRWIAAVQRLGLEAYVLEDRQRQVFRLPAVGSEQWTEWHESELSGTLVGVPPERSLAIALFSQLSSLTGSERSMLELVRELVQFERAWVTVAFPEPGPLVDACARVGASVLIAPFHTWYSAFPAGIEALETWARMSMPGIASLLRKFRRIRPHVVVSNTRLIPWGMVAAQYLDRPHVLFPREARELAEQGEWLTGLSEANELFCDNSDVVVCNSPEPAAQFGNRPKCVTVKTHIHISTEDRDEVLPSIFRRPSSFKLFHPGNMYEDKGQLDAVEAVRILEDRGCDVECAFMGWQHEPYARELRRRVEAYGLADRVHFADYHPNPYPYFLQADCVVVCTRGEAFGRVAAEALVLGVPVVATRVIGLALVVLEDETALAYDPGDFEELADALERLSSDRDLRRRLVRQGREHMATFTPQEYGGRVREILAGLKDRRATTDRGLAQLVEVWALDALADKTREHREVLTQRDEMLSKHENLLQRYEALEREIASMRAKGKEPDALTQRASFDLGALLSRISQRWRQYRDTFRQGPSP